MTTSNPLLSLGFAAIDWIEHYLVHGPGDVQGQPIELDDEFAAFIVKAYRLDARGNRRVRRAFLSRAKGRNKSGVAAMIACFEALGPCRFDHFGADGETSAWGYVYEQGEPVGRPLTYVEILNVATEEGQAGNTYDAIFYMLHPDTASQALVRDFGKIDVGITRTNLPRKRGFIEPITSADSSKDGGKSTFIVADETHLWVLPRLKRLHGIMTRNLLKRKIASGWMLETSTMYGEGEDSVAEGTHAYALGKHRDGTLLFDHRQASDKWDLVKRAERVKALEEAYGPASSWMNLAAIADSWDDPQVSEAEFRRFWLNQPVPTMVVTNTAIDAAVWAELEDPRSEAEMLGAFGLEVDKDRAFSSIGVAGLRADAKAHVELIAHRLGTGWLLAAAVEIDGEQGPLPWVIDPAGPAAPLIPELRAAGLTVIEPTAREIAHACMWLSDAVTNRMLGHGPQPELDAAVLAARRKEVGDGLYRYTRAGSATGISPIYSIALPCHALINTLPLDDVTAAYI